MARVVCIHGVGTQMLGEEQLHRRWVPALRDGMRRAGHREELSDADVAVAFYGDLFRPAGRVLGAEADAPAPAELDAYEQNLARAWWEEAAARDPGVVPPGVPTLARTPRAVAKALNALSTSPFFAEVGIRMLLGDLRQVRRYMSEPELFARIQQRVAGCVGPDTCVLVGHSLGSVVAYEALVAQPQWRVRTLVTLGSPLGMPALFARLRPPPTNGMAAWPESIASWTNVADVNDVVAAVQDLRPWFGSAVRCHTIDNGSHAHDARPYLSSVETGSAIAEGCAMTVRPA